jgi:hypothetical protein
MQAQTASIGPEAGPCAFAGKSPLQRGVFRARFKILLCRAQAIRCGQYAVEIRSTRTCFTLLSRMTRLRYFWRLNFKILIAIQLPVSPPTCKRLSHETFMNLGFEKQHPRRHCSSVDIPTCLIPSTRDAVDGKSILSYPLSVSDARGQLPEDQMYCYRVFVPQH